MTASRSFRSFDRLDEAILVVAEVGAAESVLPLVQDSAIDIVIGDPHHAGDQPAR